MLTLLVISAQRGAARLTDNGIDCTGENEYLQPMEGEAESFICSNTCESGFFERRSESDVEFKVCIEKEMCASNTFRAAGNLRECVDSNGDEYKNGKYVPPEVVYPNIL